MSVVFLQKSSLIRHWNECVAIVRWDLCSNRICLGTVRKMQDCVLNNFLGSVMSRPPSIAKSLSLIHDVPEMLECGKVRKPCVTCVRCVSPVALPPLAGDQATASQPSFRSPQHFLRLSLCQSVPETGERSCKEYLYHHQQCNTTDKSGVQANFGDH